MNDEWLYALGGAVLVVAVIYFGGSNDRRWKRSRTLTSSDGVPVRGDVKWRSATADGREVLVVLRNDEERPPSHVSGGVNLRTPFEYQWMITVSGHVWDERPAGFGPSSKSECDSMIQRAQALVAQHDKQPARDLGVSAKKKKSKRARKKNE